MSPTVSVSPHWELFEDWCAAVGLPALPATAEIVARFLHEAPAAPSTQVKRVQAIKSAHRNAGRTLLLPEPTPGSPWREGDGWLTLPETLARIPTTGWPLALAGRRDAFLAVLAAEHCPTREAIRAIRITDIRQRADGTYRIQGKAVTTTEDAASCPACAVARWLLVLDRYDDWGRSSVRSLLAGATRSDDHPCETLADYGGLGETLLLPSIDRYGWFSDWESLSARSISAVLAYRQDSSQWPTPARTLPVSEEERQVREDYQRASLSELEEVLQRFDTRAALAIKESNAMIADTEAMLKRARR